MKRRRLLLKQLTKEECKSKIFLILMTLLCIGTSFMYFFVHFSIDANKKFLNSLGKLTEQQLLYDNALSSNTTLVSSITAGFLALTGFVFVMFFYRFFRSNKKQLGSLKALGFSDRGLCLNFILFSGIISLFGGVVGLIGGFFTSDVLIKAGRESYLISEQFKGISLRSLLTGIFLPMLVFCLCTYFTYFLIRGKETAVLMAGNRQSTKESIWFRLANFCAGSFSEKKRLSVRLALRKPIAILLIIIAVMSFSVLFLMAYSLNLSSKTVVDSQLFGRSYLYDTGFDTIQTSPPMTGSAPSGDTGEVTFQTYLICEGALQANQKSVLRTVAGLGEEASLITLTDKSGKIIPSPKPSEIVIGKELEELYGFTRGDKITVTISEKSSSFVVSGVAANAKLNVVYLDKAMLCSLLSTGEFSYNGILSLENVFQGQTVISDEAKREDLSRSTVSNKTSAVINQVLGCFIGCILLYLALYQNFSSSTRELLILHLMGYRQKSIRKLLVDIYRPVLWISFLVTLFPSVLIVKGILRSLSLQIGDYMPFQTNIFVILLVFVLLNLIYLMVQATFRVLVRRIIRSEDMADYTSTE